MATQVLTPMDNKEELQDLLLNIGVLQELNRSFLNPLGLNLVLNKDRDLILQKTDDPEGVLIHTIDLFRLKVFNAHRNEKHQERYKKVGYIIQTKDLLRKDELAKKKDLHLTSPENLKLSKLLKCVDTAAYDIKRRLMENSKNKDKGAAAINFDRLFRTMEIDFELGHYIEGVTKAILIKYQEEIESELEKIKKIKEEQDQAFKEKKQ